MQQSIAKLIGIAGLSLAFAGVLVPSIGTAQITKIIDATGDGAGNTLDDPRGIAVDGLGNVYVVGRFSNNAFKIDLCPSLAASEVSRLGTPPNPNALLPGITTGPVLGATWDPVIDHTTFQPGAILDFVAVSSTPTNIASGFGTILCGVSPFLVVTGTTGAPFALSIPFDCTNLGLMLCAQGGSIDAALFIALTNALDITLGTF